MSAPLDYSLCCQTVTLYRLEDGQLVRRQIPGCGLWQQKERKNTPSGEQLQEVSLLIVPWEQEQLLPGDRVYDGIGPQITLQQWPSFVPAAYPGLTRISRVRRCSFFGEFCHWEGRSQ